MIICTASACHSEPGPFTQTVLEYCEQLQALASAGASAEGDWEALSAYVDVAEFRRVGAYLESMSWGEYTDFLSQWSGGTRFEATMFRITEVGDSVFQEIEERHYHGEDFIRKNVIAVYRFNGAGRIRHLDIYEQARDSGDWIKDAARQSTGG